MVSFAELEAKVVKRVGRRKKSTGPLALLMDGTESREGRKQHASAMQVVDAVLARDRDPMEIDDERLCRVESNSEISCKDCARKTQTNGLTRTRPSQ